MVSWLTGYWAWNARISGSCCCRLISWWSRFWSGWHSLSDSTSFTSPRYSNCGSSLPRRLLLLLSLFAWGFTVRLSVISVLRRYGRSWNPWRYMYWSGLCWFCWWKWMGFRARFIFWTACCRCCLLVVVGWLHAGFSVVTVFRFPGPDLRRKKM